MRRIKILVPIRPPGENPRRVQPQANHRRATQSRQPRAVGLNAYQNPPVRPPPQARTHAPAARNPSKTARLRPKYRGLRSQQPERSRRLAGSHDAGHPRPRRRNDRRRRAARGKHPGRRRSRAPPAHRTPRPTPSRAPNHNRSPAPLPRAGNNNHPTPSPQPPNPADAAITRSRPRTSPSRTPPRPISVCLKKNCGFPHAPKHALFVPCS